MTRPVLLPAQPGRFVRPWTIQLGLWLVQFSLLAGAISFQITTPAYADDTPFTISTRFGSAENETASMAVGDLDHDGDLDLVVGTEPDQTRSPARILAYANDGHGNFTKSWSVQPAVKSVLSVAVADLNGDRRLDIIGGDHIYLNHGTGQFGPGYPLDTSAPEVRSVAVGDVDNDGDFDVVVGKAYQDSVLNTVHLNDGHAHFPVTRTLGSTSTHTRSIALGDLNRDGYLDILVGNAPAQNMIFFNDRTGNFPTSHAQPFGITPGSVTTSLAIADVNGDQSLDIIAGKGHHTSPTGEQNIIYLNDGQGHFYSGSSETCSTPGLRCFGGPDSRTTNIAGGDIDSDGDVDLVVGNFGRSWVYRNDGVGNFSPFLPLGSNLIKAVAAADIDGNGHLDLIAGGIPFNAVYFNNGTSAIRVAILLAQPPILCSVPQLAI